MALEAISAVGRFCPPFLVLAGQLHMTQWHKQEEVEPETVISTSLSYYSNEELSLEWLKHFD